MNKFPKYLMATVASHQLGDLSRELTEQERLTYGGLKLAVFGAMSGEHSYDCGAIKICVPDQ